MIFQHTWEKVLSGQKTQTRRIVLQPTIKAHKDGDWLFGDTVYRAKPCKMGKGLHGLNYTEAKPLYQVGRTYAVQPARTKPVIWWTTNSFGKPSIYPEPIQTQANREYAAEKGFIQARIRVLFIRREDVRYISDEDVAAEGFDSRVMFWDTWCAMHDKKAYQHFLTLTANFDVWIKNRPQQFYDAWALTFELVGGTQ